MTTPKQHKDLVILVADKNMESAVKGLLSNRIASFGIKEISFDCFVHPEHDPGCLLRGHDFLKPFTKRYGHALIMLDREGCGWEDCDREQIENYIVNKLRITGWSERAIAIALDPELEAWVWNKSPETNKIIGWTSSVSELKAWLEDKGYSHDVLGKPVRPKEAFEEVLKTNRKPRSSSIFYNLAKSVGFRHCQDPAFNKLKNKLAEWFHV